MAPTLHIRLGGPGAAACNATTLSAGECTLSVHLKNLTDAEGGDGTIDAQRDNEGAMKFIIAVLLVYSLMGTTGMLILRIRQSAAKSNLDSTRKSHMKEANRYLKYRDKIGWECQRAKRLIEANRALKHIQALERQRSGCQESQSTSSTGGDALSPLLSPSHGHDEPPCHHLHANPLDPHSSSSHHFTKSHRSRPRTPEYPSVIELTCSDFPPDVPTLCVVSESPTPPEHHHTPRKHSEGHGPGSHNRPLSETPRALSSKLLDAVTLGIVPLAAADSEKNKQSAFSRPPLGPDGEPKDHQATAELSEAVSQRMGQTTPPETRDSQSGLLGSSASAGAHNTSVISHQGQHSLESKTSVDPSSEHAPLASAESDLETPRTL